MAFNVLVPTAFGNLANFLPLHYIIISVHTLQQIYLHFAKTSKRELLFFATKMSFKKFSLSSNFSHMAVHSHSLLS